MRQLRLAAGPEPQPKIRIRLLGQLQVECGGETVSHFRTQKTGAMLAYLALHGGTSVGREELIELFWPETELKAGQQSLRTALSSLQRTVEGMRPGGPRIVVSDRSAVWLDAASVETDVGSFERALADARTSPAAERACLGEAVDHYTGPLLPGRYDDWAVTERERLAALHLDAVVRLAHLTARDGDLTGALDLARRAVAIDALREEAHIALIRLLAVSGQLGAALRQYEALEQVLRDELDVEPGAEARALRAAVDAALRSGSGALEPAARPGPEPEPRSSHEARLPHSLTRFFGRDAELRTLAGEIVERGGRLVTLSGPGGAGKTRVAIAAARRMAPSFDADAVFVPLEHIADPTAIPRAILEALGAEPAPGADAAEQVASALAARSRLLVLDNFEQLVDGGAELVVALLERSPLATCLVTSRRLLRATGEVEVPIAPLPVPDVAADAATLAENESVALFVDRVRLARSDFRLSEGNVATVAEICTRLEGLPLSLELAAAWSRVLSLEQILERLERRRFDVLVSEQVDRPARHRSLWGTVESSYRMLPPALRRVFARLSVFRGGWTLETAERVCGVPRVEHSLRQLRELSLVTTEECGAEMRYRMLETLREFAAEQLGSEGPDLRRGHAEVFVDYAERWESKRFGAEEAEWIARLEAEIGNFRAALRWAASRDGDPMLLLRLAATLAQFWHVRGYWREGEVWLARALDASPREALILRAKALWWYGLSLYHHGDTVASRDRYEEALVLFREADERAGISSVLTALAGIEGLSGRYDRAEALALEGLAVSRETNDARRAAALLVLLGEITRATGRFDEAADRLEEGRRIYEEIGWKAGLALVHKEIGELARLRGDLDEADARYAESLTHARALSDEHAAALATRGLGQVALDRGEVAEAETKLAEALETLRRLGEQPELSDVLDALACVAAVRGDAARARDLTREAGELRIRCGWVAPPAAQAAVERYLSRQ